MDSTWIGNAQYVNRSLYLHNRLHWIPQSRKLSHVGHLPKHALEFWVSPILPVMVDGAPRLLGVDITVADIVRALNGPEGPVGVVILHVLAQARQVTAVLIVQAVPVAARHADAKLGQKKRPRVVLVLLENEAEEQTIVDLADAARAKVGCCDGKAVCVRLPYVLASPGRRVQLVVAERRQVGATVEAANDDEHIWIGAVYRLGSQRHVFHPDACG